MWLGEFIRRLGMLLRREKFDRDLEEEMRLHRELRAREHEQAGLTAEEARFAAQRQFGNAPLLRERSREAWGWTWLEHLAGDLLFGMRLLRRNPGFTLVAVLTLALGIGANTAIFELLNAVLLRSLPVKDPQELAEVRNVVRKPRTGNFDGRRPEMTYPMWLRIRERQEAFSGIAAWFAGRLNLSTTGEDRLSNEALWVSGEFFDVLGARPLLGRTFTATDDQPGCAAPGVVLSHAFWQREYGGDASIVGRKISLDRHLFEVIGVTQPGFFGVDVGRQFDLAIPICADAILRPEIRRLTRLDGWWLAAIGRLKPGWNTERATAQLTAISPALYQETLHPGWNPDDAKNYLALRLGAVPAANGVSGLRSTFSQPLWLLLAATGVVLLIACANLANLLLARASAREREIAVRLALGASRQRLVRQMLTESLLLAVVGAMAGAWVARALSRAAVQLISIESSPRFLPLEADWRVIAFTAGLAILTCILFGLAPALRATRITLAGAMNAGSRGSTDSRERFSLRRALVVSQIALSLVLLTGAMLFGRTLRNLTTLDAGFQQDHIAQLDVDLARVPADRRVGRLEELIAGLRATPGVEAVASSSYVPLAGSSWNDTVLVDAPEGERRGVVNFDRVSPGFFETLRIPLLKGRDFNAGDASGAPAVAIINEAFAKKFFDGADPVGKVYRVEGEAGARPLFQIVGVVGNTKYDDLRTEFGPIAYNAQRQAPAVSTYQSIVFRSPLPLAALLPAVKQAVQQTDPGISFSVINFKSQILESLVQERLMAMLTGFLGGLAGTLASLGLFGVLSYTVARRTHEIGIRVALGAHPRNVVAMILREAGVLLVAGLAIGTVLGLFAGRAADTLLFGLKSSDPATVAMAVVSLAGVALAASYLPARRAAKLDPMVALRNE